MQSNEQAAQALILDMSNFEVLTEGKTGRKSTYQALFDFIPTMEVGQIYKLGTAMGWNAERTFKHNSTNILSCIGKNEKLNGYKVVFMELQSKAIPATENAPAIPANKVIAIKLLKKPAETAPIAENLNNGKAVEDATPAPETTPVVPTEEAES